MKAYYNENDPYAAQWLRNLIDAGHIAPGDVDERSIVDVRSDDLAGYTQCHFFAGIGGWSYALRLAGWSDETAVWTGSCPCQPFSEIGPRSKFSDERDLWPFFLNHLKHGRPSMVFGEQVAEAKVWIDRAATDLEGISYTPAGAVLPACAVGSPTLRERFFFMARPAGEQMGLPRLARQQGDAAYLLGPEACNSTLGRWSDWRPIGCSDGRSRRIQPGLLFLAHGVSDRVAKLRALGNAIVPDVAAEFIRAARECIR